MVSAFVPPKLNLYAEGGVWWVTAVLGPNAIQRYECGSKSQAEQLARLLLTAPRTPKAAEKRLPPSWFSRLIGRVPAARLA